MRSRADVKFHTPIFTTKAWFLRFQARKIKAIPKKQKQEMVDTFVRKVGIRSMLKKLKSISDNK